MKHQPGNDLRTNKNDKRSISRIYKEPLQINTKNNPIEKQANNHTSISPKKKKQQQTKNTLKISLVIIKNAN